MNSSMLETRATEIETWSEIGSEISIEIWIDLGHPFVALTLQQHSE